MIDDTAQPHPGVTGEDDLPGDISKAERVARIIRVDQAGEFGAARIYAGQLAVLGKSPVAPVLRDMAAQEQRHLEAFNKLMVERRVRPTLLAPVWHVAGFALGAASALLGERAAMACTVAVEEVIDEHYAKQAAQLGDDEKPLRDLVEEFRGDENAHRDTALKHDAQDTPGYEILTGAIKSASRLAIWLSTRL